MDNRLFDFVRQFSEELAELATSIENQMFDQPNGTLIQARLYCEELVKKISLAEGLESIYPLKPAERIYRLYRQDFIPEEIYIKLNWIRQIGNKAAHDLKEIDIKDVLDAHKLIFEISIWYMEVYVSHQFTAPEYKLPIKNSQEANSLGVKDLDELIKPYINKTMDEFREEFQKHLATIKMEKEIHQAVQLANVSPQPSEFSHIKRNEKKEKLGKDSQEDIHLNQEKENLLRIFRKNNFVVTHETKKAIEFEHTSNKEIVYLLDNKETSIALHPTTVEQNDELKTEGKSRSSTALKQFPKEKNKGQNPIQYGYLFKCKTEFELDSLLNRLNSLHLEGKGNYIKKLYKVFTDNHFKLTRETTKSVEFENINTKEIVYLLPTKEISIVLNPNTVEKDFIFKDKSMKLYHNTSLNQFPKRKNKGESPIHYGYSFKFQSEGELHTFLNKMNN